MKQKSLNGVDELCPNDVALDVGHEKYIWGITTTVGRGRRGAIKYGNRPAASECRESYIQQPNEGIYCGFP